MFPCSMFQCFHPLTCRAETNRIIIEDTKGREYNFETESHDPKITSTELCRAWLGRLRALLLMAPGDFGKASHTALLL